MSIQIPQGFRVTSRQPIDDRMVLTKSEMLNMVLGRMPDNYICVCKDDGKLYIYNSAFEMSGESGKFRQYEDLLDLPAAITKGIESPEGKAALEEAMSKTLPGAIREVMANEDSAKELADAMFDSEHFDVGINNRIELAISTI